MIKKLKLYYRTIKHLKPIQIRYRLWYILRNKIRKLTGHTYPLSIPKKGHSLNLEPGLPKPSTLNLGSEALAQESPSAVCHLPSKTFTFLNQSHNFEEAIEWNIKTHGKLWAYNLNYFDYLHQEEMTKEEGLKLIQEFIDQIENNREGLEPYPISLRGINWIKFLSQHEIQDEQIDASLYAQYQILLDNIEYHLLGNHLLENGCSLLFGAYYFQDEELYNAAEQIIGEQLEEQILLDGGHFERSTMYHCIMLERLLDCYNVVRGSDWLGYGKLEGLLEEKVELMLGWLDKVACCRLKVEGCELPLLNDGARGVGPDPQDLFEYAKRLGLKSNKVKLSQSGYRKFNTELFDLICDVGAVGPDYQPGHAHSDTFSFVLYHQGKPVIIDPGISTYEDNERRQLERSTAFHNTVQYEDIEQSEVWSAFRVGRRARIDIQVEDEKELMASHDGYRPWGIRHEREWRMQEDHIYIKDFLFGREGAEGTFYLHFHPRLYDKISVEDSRIEADGIDIEFESADSIRQHSYDCPDGYNQYRKAPKVEVRFVESLVTRIGPIL